MPTIPGWSPLWSGIVDSSLWQEPDYIVKIFLTMLALKDLDHIVRLTAYQLSRRSGKTEVEVLEALKVLSSPDVRRMEPQEYEGRRIEAVEEGWLILNGAKYNEMMAKERVRSRNRRSQAAWRDRQKEKEGPKGISTGGSGMTARERLYDKQYGDGEDPDSAKDNGEPPFD